MNLISLEFLLFLGLTAALLRVVPQRWANYVLLLTSYVFYCTWDKKMAILLFAVTVISYAAALFIRKTRGRSASLITLFAVSLLIATLAWFKLRAEFHLSSSPVIPLGISYYTFRLMSYLLDVFWGKYEPERKLVPFAAYVAFFPHLVAGPIQRADSFLPQVQTGKLPAPRVLEGLSRLLLGFAKKILVADNLALFVSSAFAHLNTGSSLPSLVALYLYPVQLYADFSGLADIAIGAGLLMGIEAPENFEAPYSATSITEFWRRWHITLTAWLRDYVFMPMRMATRAWGNVGLALSVTVNMVLIGLWHGFTLGFLCYGLFHSVFLLIDVLLLSTRELRQNESSTSRNIRSFIGAVYTYNIVAFGCVLFRAPSLSLVGQLVANLFTGLKQTGAAFATLTAPPNHHAWVALPAFVLTELGDWVRRNPGFRWPASLMPRWATWSAYAGMAVTWILIALALLATEKGANPFVYAFF